MFDLSSAPDGTLLDTDALTCGQHSANAWSDASQIRPDGRHDINGHPDIRGQLSVDTILGRTRTVTDAAIRVRTNNERYANWWTAQQTRLARLGDTVRIPRVAA